ncbi:MAG: hypothetical protein WC992_03110 [Acholeplasmataceae bacterium]|jgi:hypothetical protein
MAFKTGMQIMIDGDPRQSYLLQGRAETRHGLGFDVVSLNRGDSGVGKFYDDDLNEVSREGQFSDAYLESLVAAGRAVIARTPNLYTREQLEKILLERGITEPLPSAGKQMVVSFPAQDDVGRRTWRITRSSHRSTYNKALWAVETC